MHKQVEVGLVEGRKQHQQETDKPTAQTPKADEKAYNAALKSLPNKSFDPWRGAR